MIEKLVNLGVRGKVINLIISFLSDRSHTTKIKGQSSEFLAIFCGVPQGTVGGPKLFVILINGTKCLLVDNYKFVDDKTLAHSYSGDPTCILQKALDVETAETIKDKMIINEAKCNVITFNFSDGNIPPQTLTLNGNALKTVDKIKLLGVMITSDLKWGENTELICSKVNKKLFIISKLKQFGVQKEDLINIWKVMLRPITEYAAPLWHSGLNEADINRLENLQKKVLGMILGTIYIKHKRYYNIENKAKTYDEVLQKYELTTLKQRREVLTQNFALETIKNESHKNMFTFTQEKTIMTRSKRIVHEEKYNTDRYKYSAVPYMARVLNGVYITEKRFEVL